MPEREEKVTIVCPKCKGAVGQEVCPACNGTGTLELKKIKKVRRHEEAARNWEQELKRRGMWS